MGAFTPFLLQVDLMSTNDRKSWRTGQVESRGTEDCIDILGGNAGRYAEAIGGEGVYLAPHDFTIGMAESLKISIARSRTTASE